MEYAVDRMLMTLLVPIDPFSYRCIAENDVRVAHVWTGEFGYGRGENPTPQKASQHSSPLG